MSLNETPSANRLHIGIFGKVNSGKSSFINVFTGQEVSIVSDVAGTTTDVVTKAMEVSPLGPCVFIDTAGFDDTTVLGESRKEKTRLAAEKCDIAILLFSFSDSDNVDTLKEDTVEKRFLEEKEWYDYFSQKNIPVISILNKRDGIADDEANNGVNEDICNKVHNSVDDCIYDGTDSSIYARVDNRTNVCIDSNIVNVCDKKNSGIDNRGENEFVEAIKKMTKEAPLVINAKTGEGMEHVKEALVRKMPKDFELSSITGDLVTESDVVLLVMPQDIQAPKGRLILPQVQTIRDLLDKKCIVLSVTTDKMQHALEQLKYPPKLIITDSQVFKTVYELKPKESMLTSFSILFAAYKGDLPYYIEGAKAIDRLTEHSKVLIAECCTHAPLSEDIGRVKIPNMLRKRFGTGLTVDMVSGTDFPKDLTEYDLIIQCGGCMFNRKYVLSRIDRAKKQYVPMTNYGVTIAHLTGILDMVSLG